MKKYLLLLFVLVTFGACKKDQDNVKPKGLAGEVIGTYELTSFRYQDATDDYQYPELPVVQKGKKTDYGTVVLGELEDGEPDQLVMGLSLNLASIGLELDEEEFLECEVKKSGSKYTLSADGTKIATISGNTLTFSLEDDDLLLAFTADK